MICNKYNYTRNLHFCSRVSLPAMCQVVSVSSLSVSQDNATCAGSLPNQDRGSLAKRGGCGGSEELMVLEGGPAVSLSILNSMQL